MEADSQAAGEHQKGLTALENTAHNEKVSRNARNSQWVLLRAAGYFGSGAVLGGEALKHYGTP